MAARRSLFEAIDAAQDAADFTKMAANTPEPLQPWFFTSLRGLLDGLLSRQAAARPTGVQLSKAVTAVRRLAEALGELRTHVVDQRLRVAHQQATTWPDRLRAYEGPMVFPEVSAVLELLIEYRRNADLGRPLHDPRRSPRG